MRLCRRRKPNCSIRCSNPFSDGSTTTIRRVRADNAVSAGDVVAIQANWPHHTHEISLEAEASNGRAKIVLISVTQGQIERHSFAAGHKNYLILGPVGFSSHPDKLCLVVTGQQSGTDIDVLTDYFPE
jgi:hypothetical protein